MTETSRAEKSIGEQMYELCEQKPDNYDVVFCVGREKTIVRAVKFVLKAASPVFESEFTNRWDHAVDREGNGIPLPEHDPTTFQLFIKLLFKDKWTTEYITSLKLSDDNLINLLTLCRTYNITKAIKNLEIAAASTIRTLHNKMHSLGDELMGISRSSLETILSFKELPWEELEIFHLACRWAENQCKQLRIQATGENFRRVLGGCLREIRFPTMTFQEFSKVIRAKGLLTSDERDAVYEYIGLEGHERNCYDRTQLPFQTMKRITTYKTLDLTTVFQNVTHMEVDCNASNEYCDFQSSERICLKGIGFFAPVGADSEYEVAVQIKRYNNGWSNVTENIKQTLYAQKGQVLYFLFDQEIVIEPSAYDMWNRSLYRVTYSLKGPAVSMFNEEMQNTTFTHPDSVFRFSYFNDRKHICALKFKLM